MKKFTEFLNESKAQEGEGPVQWHMSTKHEKISHFNPLSHFGTKKAARDRVKSLGRYGPAKSIYAVRIKHGKSFQIPDNPEGHEHESVLKQLHKHGMLDKSEFNHHKEKMKNLDYYKKGDHLASVIKSKGYDSLHYINRHEDKGSISHITTHPDQVRVLHSRHRDILKVRSGKKLGQYEQ